MPTGWPNYEVAASVWHGGCGYEIHDLARRGEKWRAFTLGHWWNFGRV